MRLPTWTFLITIQLPWSTAIPNCPLAGAEFPPPQTLLRHPMWQNALQTLAEKFDNIDNGGTRELDGNLNGLSYAIQVFSTNPGGGLLAERYRTAPNLRANTPGVTHVDGDTVFRLGSVSKILTVVAWLAELGDLHWNQPVTDFIPELANISAQDAKQPFDSVRKTSWKDITIGALASQVSGIGRDYGVLGELLETPNLPEALQAVFPVLPSSAKPPCGTWPLCTREEFFAGLQIMVPSYPAWQTPTYSNAGFQLFTYALENITGRAFQDILNERVIQPLGLTNTYYQIAPSSIGIIPTNVEDSYWYVDLGDADSGGSMYASANDLSALGRAILSSQLISPALTRRWLQPSVFSSDFAASVGAPWGIRRIQLDPQRQPFRTVSVFTKAGTLRQYSAFLSLVKEFNIGISILLSGKGKLNNFEIADILGSALLPAYDAAARNEADLLFGGTYVGALGLNTSMTIATDPTKPGLGVTSWINNGTDMVKLAVGLQMGTGVPSIKPDVRLYYTQLVDDTIDGGKKQSWKAVFEDTGLPWYGLGLFSTACGAWVSVTGITYGSMSLDEFVFQFSPAGNVVSVTNLALRTTLYKVYPSMVNIV